jgi:Fe(3+) dicitrate transport protein
MKYATGAGRHVNYLVQTALAAGLSLAALPVLADAGRCANPAAGELPTGSACLPLEEVTVFGTAVDVRDVAGGARLVSAEDLERFVPTDVVRAMRQVPGVSFQLEDGYGLRPNISIRGTASERSSRVTLMEDGILIAPAPYTSPSAYYFPTFGRINSIEVLKGPASITQGPYTVGGAINLLSTPVPGERGGMLRGEYGSDATWRLHGWYGSTDGNWGYLVETHQWQSDGFQGIDRSASDTGFDKQDYLAKLSYNTSPGGSVNHGFNLKLTASEEQSRQSYLGLTDDDFSRDGLRRYGLSALDEMDNEHRHVSLNWRMEFESGLAINTTVYNNDFERAWYKTEAFDADGSADAQAFSGTSWANVVGAVNRGEALGGLDSSALQGILDGADTAAGAIQIRNNAREYYSRGIQLVADLPVASGTLQQHWQFGLRLHEDEEDRLQRNDSYQQLGGQLLLSDRGLEGNAGNRVQDASAWAAFVHNRIEWQRWTFAPGLRYESIDLGRRNYSTSGANPAEREPGNQASTRENNVDIWIPGIGLLYDVNERLRLVSGVHKGFAVPGNQPGVDPEESINYELGLRYEGERFQVDLMGFLNDYENLVGLCTNSSGSNCEPGDAFNGDGAQVPGLELAMTAEWSGNDWYFPFLLSYTWMDAEFKTSFDSEFFGEVQAGDPVPYIPEQQLLLTAGVERGDFRGNLSINLVDDVCTQASCGAFERTESATLADLALHYRISKSWEVYAIAENLLDEIYIAARQPYGARPGKARSYSMGLRLDF